MVKACEVPVFLSHDGYLYHAMPNDELTSTSTGPR